MPASEAQDVRRGRLLHGLFWSGVGLAPLAILVLLFGQSTGSLRVAVILAVITIVLLAVSIALRPGVELVRVDIEERVLDEVERVRMRAREDITTAARNTHRALSDKIRMLAETVEALRGQIEDLQVGSVRVGPPPPAPAPVATQSAAPGVVRRTETVQMTRSTTTVDTGDDDARGTVYGSRTAMDGEWSNGRDGPRTERPDHGGDRVVAWDERSEGTGAGGRWEPVHSDDDARELRPGERRPPIGDDRGTELRVEDRWAAVRRDDPRVRGSDDQYGESDWEATFRSLSRKQSATPALPPAPGRPSSWYTDKRDDDDRERARSRGRDRDRERRHDRDREYDRERERGDRSQDRDRGHDGDDSSIPRPRSPHPREYDR